MTARRDFLKTLAALPALPLLTGCALPPARRQAGGREQIEGVIADLRAAITAAMEEKKMVGLSIALLDDQQLLWTEGFGYADRAAGRGVTPQTRFRAGSISKLFTAVAALQLAEAGKLPLDAPLPALLPEFTLRSRDSGQPDPARAITPRLLLTHHAGLPADRTEGMWSDQPRALSSLLLELREEYPAAPPGGFYAYCNLGFSLLGLAIERAAGMPFDRYLRERVLAPLGMGTAEFESRPPPETLAYDSEGEPAHEPGLRDTPAGGLNVSAPELLQLARMWFAQGQSEGRRILDPASLREMARPQLATPLDLDLQVGLAWHFQPEAIRGGGPVLAHDGGTPHHHASLLLLPEQKLAVAVLANSAGGNHKVNELASRALGLLFEAKSGIAQGKPGSDATLDARFPPAPGERFPGWWDTQYGVVEIDGEDDRLRVQLGGETLRLVRRESGYLGLEYRLLGLFAIDLGLLSTLEFTVADIAGQRCLLARRGRSFYRAGTRLTPVPVPEAWLGRLGHYRYAGRDPYLAANSGAVELKLDRGMLLVESRAKEGVARLALAPAGEEAAIVRGIGRGRGETVHVRPRAGNETLFYAGMPFRRQSGGGGS